VVEIVGVTNYVTTVDVPVAHMFSAPGTFIINGSHDDGNVTTASMTVKVVEHHFTSDPSCMVGATRNWDNLAVPEEAVFEIDHRLLKARFVQNLTSGGRRTSVLIDQIEPRYLASRIGADGPILDSATAKGFKLLSNEQTYVHTIDTFEDGSSLVETLLVLSPIVSEITIQVQIVVGGFTFDDGTLYKELAPSDFDELGQYHLRFIRPAQAETSICHTITVMQGDELEVVS
jgi:hypothetical protein